MHETEYIDDIGRKFRVYVPHEGDPPEYGIIIGPPFLDDLDLPEDVMVRLHNELYRRKLYTKRDIRVRNQAIFAALQSALRVDVGRITGMYQDG